MIKISRHTVKFANKSKRDNLNSFLKEYRRVAALILDHLWFNTYHWNNKVLDIKNNKYDCPSFISTVGLNINTDLSARALKCCSTQVCSAIKASLEKPRKRLYILEKLQKQGKDTSRLQRAITKQKIIKPSLKNIKAELNSICCDYKEDNGSFNGYIQLRSLGKKYGKIRLPIKYHRQANRLKARGTLMNSFLVNSNSVDFRWKLLDKKPKTKGLTLGADQGYKDVVTLSNGLTTPKKCNHNHSLETISKKLARKKKGSKAFEKAQAHRKNFVNWSINQLNLKDIKQIKLEEIINIRYKRSSSRLMSHWCNTLIRDKLLDRCKEEEVLISLQPSAYRSQRCFSCGWVCKSNRVSKKFKCKKCGHCNDADVNAAQNISLDLPRVSFDLRSQKLNRNGFYWTEKGFSFDGVKFTVSLSKKTAKDIFPCF